MGGYGTPFDFPTYLRKQTGNATRNTVVHWSRFHLPEPPDWDPDLGYVSYLSKPHASFCLGLRTTYTILLSPRRDWPDQTWVPRAQPRSQHGQCFTFKVQLGIRITKPTHRSIGLWTSWLTLPHTVNRDSVALLVLAYGSHRQREWTAVARRNAWSMLSSTLNVHH